MTDLTNALAAAGAKGRALRPKDAARLASSLGIPMRERQAERLFAESPGFPRFWVMNRQYVWEADLLAYLSPQRAGGRR